MSAAHSCARSCAQPAARAVNARWGSSSNLPRLDPGEKFLTDDTGAYLTDDTGAYLTGEEE